MSRPIRHRKMYQPPMARGFRPIGMVGRSANEVVLLLEEYEAIKGSALSLLKLNNNTKVKVVSLIDALKKLKYRLYSLMESEHED